MISGFTQIEECLGWHAEELPIYQSSLFRVRKYLFLHLHDKYYVIFNVIPPQKIVKYATACHAPAKARNTLRTER